MPHNYISGRGYVLYLLLTAPNGATSFTTDAVFAFVAFTQTASGVVDRRPTLEGTGGLLSQSEVLLRQMVDRLVLVDLHTGAYVALSMQEEGEGAGKVLTARKRRKRERERDESFGITLL